MKTSILIAVMAFSSVSFAKGNPTGCTKGLGGSTTGLSRQGVNKLADHFENKGKVAKTQTAEITPANSTK